MYAGPEGDEEELEGGRNHRRGLAPFVFVPWEQVGSHVLNLPVNQLDYFMPG